MGEWPRGLGGMLIEGAALPEGGARISISRGGDKVIFGAVSGEWRGSSGRIGPKGAFASGGALLSTLYKRHKARPTDFLLIFAPMLITFDVFIRRALVCAAAVAAVFVVRFLSPVLLPFLVAWLFAYMLFPLVRWLEGPCRLRSRMLSVVVALGLVVGAVALVLALVIPPTVRELGKVVSLGVGFVSEYVADNAAVESLEAWATDFYDKGGVLQLLERDGVQQVLRMALMNLWGLVCSAVGWVMGLVGVVIVFLYVFFILADYERVGSGVLRLLPEKKRAIVGSVLRDVEAGMNSYFRGQALIALIVGVLFAVGFSIIGLPLGLGLGLFIGLLNLVPYLQVVGLVPTLLCALALSAETGRSFWVIALWVGVVFVVVQVVQDFVLTPRIMGKAMGLRPAVILLSLSVWGYVLGFVGLIIALPLTTVVVSYYRRYVLKERQ